MEATDLVIWVLVVVATVLSMVAGSLAWRLYTGKAATKKQSEGWVESERAATEKKQESGKNSNDLIQRASNLFRSVSPSFHNSPPKNWEKLEKIGSGSNGIVYKGRRKNGSIFAVKSLQVGSSTRLTTLMKEVNMMCELRHDCIIRVFGGKYEKPTSTLNIFMEFADGGSLGELSRLRPILEPEMKNYLHNILSGVHFLHSKKVVHRDIKGDNILLMSDGSAKLSDFGACKEVEIEKTMQAGTLIGTPLWMAPEAMTGEACKASDIWSIGCVVVEMLTGSPPWKPFANHWQAMLVIGQWSEPLPLNVPTDISPNCLDFLTKCFCPNPKHRPSCATLLSHPLMMPSDVSTYQPAILPVSDFSDRYFDAFATYERL
eukprot:TRINITY_DN8321_c0_g1_i1.p1 TRINITY_DN8321_c0_g1~~TRINITY_DN8321_c0_g1_i1.p1  ORF type:complete len:374 (+),score=57.43 TRINITY_DN8321_c0_g1_i1:65-1186(+)